MEKLSIINNDNINNFNNKDLLKIFETFNILYDMTSDPDDMKILKSTYVKVENKYRVNDEKYDIVKMHYNVIYNKLCLAYQNANLTDVDLKKVLKSVAVQKVFYDEYSDRNDELTLRDLWYLFDSKSDVKLYYDLKDYYEYCHKYYCIKVFIPAWNTQGYAISNDKLKTLKR